MHLLIKRIIPLFFFLGFPFDNLLLYFEAIDVAIVTLLGQSKKDKDLIIVLADGASYSSVKLAAQELVNPYELALLDPVEPDVAVVEIPGNYSYGILVDFLDYGLDGGRRDTGIIDSFEVGIVFVKTHEEEHVFLAVSVAAAEDQQSLVIGVLRGVEWEILVGAFEAADDFVFGQAGLHIIVKLLTLDFVLFVIPSKLLEIQIDKIVEELSFSVHASNYEHVLPHQHSSMTPPALNGLFIVHLKRPRGPGLQVYEVDSIEADPAFPADVICAHASKDYDEPVLVENGGVIAAG